MRIHRLDGIRALAIIAVFLSHQAILPGGWVGVDLFFGLSGFLITGILRRSRNRESYWRPFYIKRATRIMPPVLLLIAVVAYRKHPPLHSLLEYIFFLGNFANGRSSAIYDLGLLWSLAVEEHFYLLFPFAVRYMERASLIKLLTAIVVAEPILRFVATSHVSGYLPIYSWTFFHIDGLALGALLALVAEEPEATAIAARWSAPVGITAATIFAGLALGLPGRFVRENNSHLFNLVGYSLISLTCTALIAYVLWHPKALLSRVLDLRPLTFIGVISYGLYLYHQTVRSALMRLTGLGMRRLAPLSFAAVVLIGWLIFKFYEEPFLRWGHRLAASYDQRNSAAAASTAEALGQEGATSS